MGWAGLGWAAGVTSIAMSAEKVEAVKTCT